jgi:hypothetical protein
MRPMVFTAATMIALAVAVTARADDFSLHGYADFRVVSPDQDEKSWLDGGLGLFRYGASQPDPNFRFAEAFAEVRLNLGDSFHVVASARGDSKTRSRVDALEAYVSYTPMSDGDWRWSAKAGAFFPPLSLENTDLGWTSPYTLTPSAIDSWIGDELRTIGVEATIAYQTGFGSISVVGAAFQYNDPAGVLIADRGWSLDDRPTGLFEKVRIPNATVLLFGGTPPARTPMFWEIDNRVGWYAGLGASFRGIGKLSVYRYDNEADPFKDYDEVYAWHTRFWSVGWETHAGAFSILAQVMRGDTVIFTSRTNFSSAYALIADDIDADWRIAARAEIFRTDGGYDSPMSEHGGALTGALNWMPRHWLRLTGEAIWQTSVREERFEEGIAAKQSGVQAQLSARFSI